MLKITNYLMGLFGYVTCRVCSKWTEPSVIKGNICSVECVMKEEARKCLDQ